MLQVILSSWICAREWSKIDSCTSETDDIRSNLPELSQPEAISAMEKKGSLTREDCEGDEERDEERKHIEVVVQFQD